MTQSWIWTRLLAPVLIATPLLLHALASGTGIGRDGAQFVSILCICGGLVLFSRGAGLRRGGVMGAVLGVLTALAFAESARPMIPMLLFGSVAVLIMGTLGFLAGAWTPDAEAPRLIAPTALRHATHGASAAHTDRRSSEDILGAIVADFCRWTESDPARSLWTGHGGWAAFDQFVRQTLREHLGAGGVRIFRVSAEPGKLEAIGGAAPSAAIIASAEDGLIGHLISTGEVYVRGDDTQGLLVAELARAEMERNLEAADAASAKLPWTWLLPLALGRAPAALVVIEQVDESKTRGKALALALREHLQLFWACVGHAQALHESTRTDRSTGILNRVELMKELRDTARAAARESEPIMILALALEGLRQLEDSGQYSRRDMLIQQFGRTLRQRMRTDDILGRFSDDRFVIVLRRLDSALGTMIAENLLGTLREQVLDAFSADCITAGEPGAAQSATLRLRAGLAGTGLQAGGGATFIDMQRPIVAPHEPVVAADGISLLERAIGLLDYARSQRIEIATDTMEGLPSELLRGGRPASNALEDSAKNPDRNDVEPNALGASPADAQERIPGGVST